MGQEHVGATKEIELTQDTVAIVDAFDYERLSSWKWYAERNGNTWYARRNVRLKDGTRSAVYMHREILEVDFTEEVDHRNRNGLDNRRANLRIATKQQNSCNRSAPITNTSGFKGVSWHKRHRKWYAHINIEGKRKHLGHFESAKEAAEAYDRAAMEKYGEFAKTNFPGNQVFA